MPPSVYLSCRTQTTAFNYPGNSSELPSLSLNSSVPQMASSAAWFILGVFLALYCLRQKPDARLKQIPIIRYSDYLPDILNRFLFYPKAKSMIYSSYEKVRYCVYEELCGADVTHSSRMFPSVCSLVMERLSFCLSSMWRS